MEGFGIWLLVVGIGALMAGSLWLIDYLVERHFETSQRKRENAYALQCRHGLAKFRKCSACTEEFAKGVEPTYRQSKPGELSLGVSGQDIVLQPDQRGLLDAWAEEDPAIEKADADRWSELFVAMATEKSSAVRPPLGDLPEVPRPTERSINCAVTGAHQWDVRENWIVCRGCDLPKDAWICGVRDAEEKLRLIEQDARKACSVTVPSRVMVSWAETVLALEREIARLRFRR